MLRMSLAHCEWRDIGDGAEVVDGASRLSDSDRTRSSQF